MKKVIFISGTMGSGKSAAARQLNEIAEDSVWLDGDWCWMMNPFRVNEKSKAMVLANIRFMLNQYLNCGLFKHVLFSWVMDEPETVLTLLSGLSGDFEFYHFTLMPSQAKLTEQLEKDIAAGLRLADCIPSSLSRLDHYQNIASVKILTDEKTPEQIAREILNHAHSAPGQSKLRHGGGHDEN